MRFSKPATLLVAVTLLGAGRLYAGEPADQVRQYLVATFRLDPQLTEIALRPEIEDLHIADSIQVSVSSREYPEPDGFFPVKITLSSPSGQTRSLATSVEVKRFLMVPVAKARIARLEPLSEEMFKVTRIEAAKVAGTPVLDLAEVQGMRAGQAIASGRALTHELFEPIPVVNRGERVRVVYLSAGLRIETSGIAARDAIAGQTVEIKNSNTGKKIFGRAGADGIVYVAR